MRRGFDQPTSNSVSRSTSTGSREHPKRTRQARNNVPVQADSTSALSKSLNQPDLALPQQPHDFQPASSGRKSPAYLEGKNPYGQILDNVDHPYRRPNTSGSAPPQIGATSDSRPRTLGSFQFKTRPEPKAAPERKVTAPKPPPAVLPPKMPATPVSVRATKDFFESKVSQNGSAPPLLPPRASAATKGAGSRSAVTKKQASFFSRRWSKDGVRQPARGSEPTSHIPVRPESDTEPSMPRPPPDASSQIELFQRTNPFARPKSDSLAPKVFVYKATARQDFLTCEDLSSSGTSEQKFGRRESTNISNTAPRDAKPLGFERRAVDDSSTLDESSNAPLIGLEHANRSNDRHTSDETVRRHPTYRSVSAAESDEGAIEEAISSSTQARRPEPARHVRRTFEDDIASAAKRVRKRKSRSAPMTDEGYSLTRDIESGSRRSSATDVDQPSAPSQEGASGSVFKRFEDIAANSFSHDGSSSVPSISRRSTASGSVRQSVARTPSEDHHVTVPDHVDWRAAYGRRNTKDFGYPGARVKLHGTCRTYKPLQDPNHWIQRACGHFSYMADAESPEEASKKFCHQCATKSLPPLSQPAKQQRTPRRLSASSSSSHSSEKVDDACCRSPRRRHHYSERSLVDKCGDTYAKDLGHIIDAILEEHTNTLQGIINNIKHSQPTLAQLRRASEDLVQRYQIGVDAADPCHTLCRPSCRRHLAYQPGQPISYRQLAPNLNDRKSTLHENIKTVPDLVELINSAADDLGVDLDKLPTAKDNEAFRNAPVQDSSTTSAFSRYIFSEVVEETVAEGTQPAEDTWLEQTRKNLTELCEAQSQLMGECDEITEGYGVPAQERRDSEPSSEPVQQVLGKVSTGLPKESSRLGNKSVDSVAKEIPRIIHQQIDERRLSRVLTRISTQSGRMSVLELGPLFEDIEEQPDFEPEFEYVQEPGIIYGEYAPPQCLYTGPLVELQDRISDLERLLRQRKLQLTSSDYE
ncbi:hypothetical protein E8E12_005883 [Didymella heteroderae]|uniref:Uncharacterized protein n=1 Tax=Didymella heteroderae TaxID=1769908 RepID=A0A9P5C4Q1_9PLEO|nr:hypothetical protein E8E12_005883 [Didymella heteroderae]